MDHALTSHDALALGMFLAGALMAFTPLVAAGAVLYVWWRGRARGAADGRRGVPPAPPPQAP